MVRCAGCSLSITGEILQALERAWHLECFVCGACRRPIGRKPYVIDQTYPYHPDCFVCAGCQRPIGNQAFMREGGKPYHRNCYTERFVARCAGCGRPLEDGGLVALGQSWHRDCFCCGHCRKPVKDAKFLEKDMRPYHESCYHARFTPHCAICQQPLTSVYLTDLFGNQTCATHKQQLPACCSCGRLVCAQLTGGGRSYPDKRTICNLCYRTAVMDQAAAAALVAEMRQQLGRLGMTLHKRAVIPFRLVDTPELERAKKGRKGQADVLGQTRKQCTTNGHGQIIDREVQEIVILYGLPEEQFRTVALHELCHAWLHLSAYDELPLQVEEGLCTLTEYLYLRELNTPSSQARIAALEANPDPIYGEGFRLARQMFERVGLSRLLTYVKTKGSFKKPSLLSRLFG